MCGVSVIDILFGSLHFLHTSPSLGPYLWPLCVSSAHLLRRSDLLLQTNVASHMRA